MTQNMPRLQDDELEFFRTNGYFKPIKVYEPEEIERLWKKERFNLLDRSNAVYQLDEISGNTNISNYDRHLDMDFFADHITHPAIVGRVCSVLGPDVVCWRSEFFPKYPGDEGTDWHQADTFANASGRPQIIWPKNKEFGGTITVWTAFTDTTIETGCMQFIPGTQGTMYYDEEKEMKYAPDTINSQVKEGGIKRGFFGYNYQDLKRDPDWEPDMSKAVSVELKAGEAVMFWSTLMHAAHGHAGKTNKMRLAYVGRYIPTSVAVYPDTSDIEEYGGRISLERFGSVLVAGEDRFGINRLSAETTRGHKFRKMAWSPVS